MSSLPQPIPNMTEAEYLEFERISEHRHEYFDTNLACTRD